MMGLNPPPTLLLSLVHTQIACRHMHMHNIEFYSEIIPPNSSSLDLALFLAGTCTLRTHIHSATYHIKLFVGCDQN